MTKEREALKMALEAAEIGLANLTSYQSAPRGPTIHEYGQAVRALKKVREAKEALAQPAQPVQGGRRGNQIWMASADGRKPFGGTFNLITGSFWASVGGGPVIKRPIKMTHSEQKKPPTT